MFFPDDVRANVYSYLMKTCIALFRGINVGGNNLLPMKELRAVLEDLGMEDVRTYIQSGNAVFRTTEDEPKSLHVFFLESTPENPDLDGIETLKQESERYHLDGRVFYLHAPEGIGRSKLSARVERLVGVPVTARNWRTVSRIAEMAEELE